MYEKRNSQNEKFKPINLKAMFFNKKLSALEKRVEVLEDKVSRLISISNEQNKELEDLLERFRKYEAKQQAKPRPKPKYQNGKEKSGTTK